MSIFHSRGRLGHAGLLFALLTASAAGAQGNLPHIPATRGTLLSGQAVSLPEALHGKVGVLVIGFSQASRGDVTNWGRKLGSDYFDSPAIAYYELAMVAEVPRFLRGIVTRKIKDQVSERGQMHFLPIGDHEDEWKAAAGYANTDDAYILLVDGAGAVVWRMNGPLSGPGYAELQKRMQAVLR